MFRPLRGGPVTEAGIIHLPVEAPQPARASPPGISPAVSRQPGRADAGGDAVRARGAAPCAMTLRGLEMFSGEPEGPDGPRAGGAASRESAPAVDARRLRVAIVEDEAIIAIEIEDMLTEMGAEVVGVALTAEEAIRLAEDERPDAMTMDVRLSGDRDGISAALEIFERFGIRCVFVSAYGDAATVARGQSASPLGWVTKPLSRDRLEEPLRSIWPGGKV